MTKTKRVCFYVIALFGLLIATRLLADTGATPDANDLTTIERETEKPLAHLNAPILHAIVLKSKLPTSYTVKWSKVAGADHYILQQDSTSAFANPTVAAQGNIVSKIFSNQSNGTYYYRVQASKGSTTSDYSNFQKIVISASSVSLSTPKLQAIAYTLGSSSYQINWNSVKNAQEYALQESLSGDFSNPQTIYKGPNLYYGVSGKAAGTYFYRLIALAGNVASLPSNSEEVTVNPNNSPPSATFVEGYWESWSSDPINAIVNMSVDVIDVAFVTFASQGNHTFKVSGLDVDQSGLAQFIAAAHGAGKKVKVSVGGASYGQGGFLKTVEDASGMAQAISAFVQANNLDGVDFDIEDYPAAALQISLIQNTRQLLGDKALISYTPETPASTTSPYEEVIKGAHPYLTSISLMAYDYEPGYSYQTDIQQLIQMGVPRAKIVLGLMPGYDDLHVMTSVANITTAANYVLEEKLGGVMFWSLNRDYNNQTKLGSEAATHAAWNLLR